MGLKLQNLIWKHQGRGAEKFPTLCCEAAESMNSMPPLVALAAGRKPRIHKAPVYRPKEITLHMSVAKILREHCHEWQWTHMPTGERRDKKLVRSKKTGKTRFISPTGSKLKQMGMKRGWPDFVLIAPTGKLYCLELKRVAEGLTDEQEDFRTWCIIHGVPYVVAHSNDEVMAAFERWYCIDQSVSTAWRASRSKMNDPSYTA